MLCQMGLHPGPRAGAVRPQGSGIRLTRPNRVPRRCPSWQQRRFWSSGGPGLVLAAYPILIDTSTACCWPRLRGPPFCSGSSGCYVNLRQVLLTAWCRLLLQCGRPSGAGIMHDAGAAMAWQWGTQPSLGGAHCLLQCKYTPHGASGGLVWPCVPSGGWHTARCGCSHALEAACSGCRLASDPA